MLKTKQTKQTKQTAFTLAEVLITLGIIGIVAAMTMPGLISGYRKGVVETQLKKAYSEMTEAIRRSEVDNGEVENWEWCTQANYNQINCQNKFFDKYLRPYMKIIKTENYTNYADDISGGYLFPYYTLASGAKISFVARLEWNSPTQYGYGIFKVFTTNNRNIMQAGKNIFSFHLKKYNNGVRLVPEYYRDWQCEYMDVPANKSVFVNNCQKLAPGDTSGIVPSSYCTFMIYCNNWKVPDYYPIKF